MKRVVNTSEESPMKRAKLDIPNDDWDDTDIDEYLLQATQNCDQQLPYINQATSSSSNSTSKYEASESIHYSAFNTGNVVASTQLPDSSWAQPVPLTSHVNKPNNKFTVGSHHISQEVELLKQQITIKDGEVSVLRSQIKKLKEQHDQEKENTIRNITDKINQLQTERDKFSSQLEFKNLENANLKMKLESFSKNTDLTMVSENSKFGATTTLQGGPEVDLHNYEQIIIPVVGTSYPLKEIIPMKIFESHEHDKFPNIKQLKESNEHYAHSLMLSKELDQNCKGVFTNVSYKEKLQLKHFFPVIHFLRNASLQELQNDRSCINQIFLFTYSQLNNQLEYFATFSKHVKSDEIREFDVAYLAEQNRDMHSNSCLLDPTICCENSKECGIQCRQGLALLAHIYPYSNHLRQLITSNNFLQINEQERFTWPYSFDNLLTGNKEINLLKLILRLTIKIGQTRRRNVYTGFLSSVSKLLAQIVSYDIEKLSRFDLIGQITKEIALTLPTYPVLLSLSELLRNGARCIEFLNQLCCMPLESHVQKKNKKRIMLVNNLCCTIEIYFNQCREPIKYFLFNDSSGDYRLHLNLIQFVDCALAYDVKWMYFFRENAHFSCQIELYKLSLDIIYGISTKYKDLMDLDLDVPDTILRIVKFSPGILNKLYNKYVELIEVNEQYNAILKTCQMLLTELNLNEWMENNSEESDSIDWQILQSLKL